MSVLREVHDALATRATRATAARATVGDRALLVECAHPDHGALAGVAHRPRGAVAAAESATTVAEYARLAVAAPAGSVDRAVGVATLNALSTPDVEWLVGDPMAALSPAVEVVTTVGLFRPAFRRFGDVAVRVIERDPGAVDADSLPADVPTTLFAPREAPEAVVGCDVLFVTGATLVYGGVETYLDAATAADVPAVVLIGATASFLPDPVFVRGVDLLAGARVLDPTRVRERVAAGDCGTGLHDAGVRKVYHPSTPALPGLDSLTGRPETGGRDP